MRSSASRPLRVVHVGKYYPPHMGGIETQLQLLCGELRKSVDLQVIVASDGLKRTDEVVDGVPVVRVPTLFTLASAPVCPGMVRRILAFDPDLVHLHLPNPSALLAFLASRHRARLVVSYHSDTVRQKFLGRAFEPFLHAALRRSDAIIVSSPEYQRTSSVLARYSDRCCVIPYGISTGQFDHPDPSVIDRVRRQYGDRLVLSVGRLVYYKGFEYLIRAMKSVRGKLLIIGEGPLRGSLEQLASDLGVREKVVFAGGIPGELTAFYQAADVFVLASIARSEAFGIVQVEAMAAGVPVINTGLDSGVPFVSLHEQTGLTVPPADDRALADAMNRLLDDSELRRSLGQAGRARAEKEFTVETMAARTLALYEKVMS